MIVARQTASRQYILEAYSAINPSRPRWSEISFTEVQGWRRYQNWGERGSKFFRDPRLTQEYNSWRFVSAEAAQEVLAELLELGQQRWLRVIQRDHVQIDQVLGGYNIGDGNVVRAPDGSEPTFMGEPVPGCNPDMPDLINYS